LQPGRLNNLKRLIQSLFFGRGFFMDEIQQVYFSFGRCKNATSIP